VVVALVLVAGVACKKKPPIAPTLPDYSGTWNGTYTVTSCTNSGFFSDANFCAGVLNTSASVTFTFAQTDRTVTGSFQLGSLSFTSVSSEVATDQSLTVARAINDSGFSIDATWTLTQNTAGTLTGQTHQIWKAIGQSGDATLDGQMASATR
jgi:hypothetical protein